MSIPLVYLVCLVVHKHTAIWPYYAPILHLSPTPSEDTWWDTRWNVTTRIPMTHSSIYFPCINSFDPLLRILPLPHQAKLSTPKFLRLPLVLPFGEGYVYTYNKRCFRSHLLRLPRCGPKECGSCRWTYSGVQASELKQLGFIIDEGQSIGKICMEPSYDT